METTPLVPFSWGSSLGVSSKHPGECCPDCNWCCGFTAYYYNFEDTSNSVARAQGRRSCCNPFCASGDVSSVIDGASVRYQHEYNCCLPPTGRIHLTINDSTSIGTIDVNNRQYCKPITCFGCCGTDDFVLVNAKDAAGHSRFTVREPGVEGACFKCCPHMCSCECDDGCCDPAVLCFAMYRIPVEGPVGRGHRDDALRGDHVGHLTVRHARIPCCTVCCPTWFGFREWPAHASDQDKLLLLGVIHGALWLHNGFARML